MSFRNVLLAIASALLLSACGASAGTAPVAGAPARASGADAPSYKIYIANAGNNTITTYTSEGTQTSPTIQTVPAQPTTFSPWQSVRAARSML